MAKKESLAETNPELIEEWHPTLNGDLQPHEISKWSDLQIWWKCLNGKWPDGRFANDHEWQATPHNRTNKSGKNKGGCPCCSNRKAVLSNCLATTHPDLAQEWHPVKNEVTSSEIVAGCNAKYWWKCPLGIDHEWEATVSSRAYGKNGCPCCSGKKAVSSNCLATTHPEIAKQWHPTKNSLSANDVTVGSGKTIWWKCPVADDHVWKASVAHRTSKDATSCPYCAGQKVVSSNCLATTHPEIAKQWHPTKNGKLTPNDVTVGSGKKVWWKCPVADDHVWEVSVCNMIVCGCPCCSNRKAVLSNCLATTHPEIAKQWHPTKNGKLTPNDVTVGSDKTIWWKCPVADDHVWKSALYTRKRNGCSCCSNRKVVLSNCLATTHPEIAKQWHPTKNGKLTPNDVTAGRRKKVWWLCDKGHAYFSSVNGRTSREYGCPVCKESKGEKTIRLYLEKKCIRHQSQYCFATSEISRSRFDFALHNLLIEYHGSQHYFPTSFGSKKRYAKHYNFLNIIERDHKKLQWCRQHNIPLLIIPYWDKDRIPEILDDVFAGRTPTFSESPEIVKKYELLRKKIRDHLGITEPEVLCGLIKPESKEKAA